MADDDTAAADEAADAEMNAAFDREAPSEKPAAQPTDETAIAAPANPVPKAATPAAATPAATRQTPKYKQITEEEWTALSAAAAKTASLESQLSKVFGTVGNMQQAVAKLRETTPAGAVVEIPDGAFAEMERDFPELAAHTRAALERVLKNVRGTGTAVAAADPEAVNTAVSERILAHEIEALTDAHPDWRATVGAVSDGKYDATNPFRQWLATKDAAYQAKLNATNSAAVIARAIDRFKAETKRPVVPAQAARVPARQDRIRAAIQPKGDGGLPTPTKTADDEFQSGFAAG